MSNSDLNEIISPQGQITLENLKTVDKPEEVTFHEKYYQNIELNKNIKLTPSISAGTGIETSKDLQNRYSQ